MSSHSDDTSSRQGANERLDVPTLPPPSSRFVLPPPPSDLLNRLQAFLPQIRDANAILEQQQATQPEGAAVEEPVVMEELSDSSSDSSESSDDSSDEDNEEDEAQTDPDGSLLDLDGLDGKDGDGTNAAEGVDAVENGEGPLARLMDISSRPKVVKHKLLVQEQVDGDPAAPSDESMQAD